MKTNLRQSFVLQKNKREKMVWTLCHLSTGTKNPDSCTIRSNICCILKYLCVAAKTKSKKQTLLNVLVTKQKQNRPTTTVKPTPTG